MAGSGDFPISADPRDGSPGSAQLLEPCFTPRPYTPVTEELLSHIVDLFTEGKNFEEIAALPGMPSIGTLYRCYRDDQTFRDQVAKARATVAFQSEQEIRRIAKDAESLGKDDVPGARLAFDAHNRIAEINDPGTYGKKQQISGDSQRPIVFQFLSHIPKPEKEEIDVTPEPEPPNAA